MRKPVILGIVILVAVVAGVAWWVLRPSADDSSLTLYGNVDIRQVSLAFDASDRIAALYVEEGDRVNKGQALAQLDIRTVELEQAKAQALAAAQGLALERLRNGTRPEEVAQANARLQAAEAQAALATQDIKRLELVSRETGGRAVVRQEVDRARAQLAVAKARVEEMRLALSLAQAGPRDEDIAEAQARFRSAEAQAALLAHRLQLATLTAPSAGVIRSRLLEVGDMASPQRPVFALALTDRKWVRAYVDEPELGRVFPGMKASVYIDSQPDRAIQGTVGFISSVAEFTPKSVQTEALRTSLVYEVRILVEDSEDILRLGMPATVHLKDGRKQ